MKLTHRLTVSPETDKELIREVLIDRTNWINRSAPRNVFFNHDIILNEIGEFIYYNAVEESRVAISDCQVMTIESYHQSNNLFSLGEL